MNINNKNSEIEFAVGDQVLPDEKEFRFIFPYDTKQALFRELEANKLIVREIKNHICTCDSKKGSDPGKHRDTVDSCPINRACHPQMLIFEIDGRRRSFSGSLFKKKK